MKKYFSTAKLASLIDIDLTKLYDTIKNTNTMSQYDQRDIYVFEYLNSNTTEQNNQVIQYVYDKFSQQLHIRFTSSAVQYGQREEQYYQLKSATNKTAATMKSPEIQFATKLSTHRSIYQVFIYIQLINYVLQKLNANTENIKDIIEQSSIETDNVYDVFNIPQSDEPKNKRLGNYLYINGMDNGSYFDKLPSIIDEVDDSDHKYLHLLAYAHSLVPRLSFIELNDLEVNIQKAHRDISNAYGYYMPDAAKDYFAHYLSYVQSQIEVYRKRELESKIQTIPLSVWKHSRELSQHIQNGAKVRIVLPMTMTSNTYNEKEDN